MEQDVRAKSKAENPLISVIVRTKDRPKLLRNALQSIAGQTYRPIEVVLVNDGGCDLDVKELKSILGDVSLNYQRLEKNTGRAHAGNVGIENAKGEYIGFLDDDDEFYPEHVETLISVLNQVDYKVVYADAEIVFKEYNSEKGEFIEKEKRIYSSRDFVYEELFVGNYIPLMSLLFKEEVMRFAKGFDEAFDLYEDWDLLIQCGQKYPFCHVKKITSRYIQWSKELQIAQPENSSRLVEFTHDRVISKHRDKISPNVVRYLVSLAKNMERDKDAVIGDKNLHIGNLETILRDKNTHIGNLEAALDEKNTHIGNLEAALDEKNTHIGNLEAALEKNTSIENLEAALDEKNTHIRNLEAALDEKNTSIGKLEVDLNEKRNLEAALGDKDAHILNLEAILNGIYNSDGWKALLAYYRVRDKIFPAASKRRHAAKFIRDLFGGSKSAPTSLLKRDNIKKSFFYIRAYGIKAFIKKVRGKLESQSTSFHKPNVPILKLPAIGEEKINTYEDASISVIIPTKDAGNDFELLMSVLKEQRGLKSIEIIIVDSGSTDSTLEIAGAYGARIIEIPPEKFSHSFSRNIGAEAASCKYLFFTVQDALPSSKTFLYELYCVLQANEVSAVSCAEFPREDADLFYSVLLWNHYRFLEVDRRDRIFALPETVTHFDLRKNGQLSDMACFISKNTFSMFKYDTDYGEDLDLGIRMIKAGHKLAFLGSLRIIHSHNRPPGYFLKRGYVDNLFLTRIFPDYPLPLIDEERLLRDITAYPFLVSFIQEDLGSLKMPIGVEELFDVVQRKLGAFDRMTYPPLPGYCDCPQFDDFLKSFLLQISENCETNRKQTAYNGILFPAVLNYLDIVKEYMLSTYESIDEKILDDFKLLLVKVYALNCGAHLAFCFLNGGSFLKSLHEDLKRGI